MAIFAVLSASNTPDLERSIQLRYSDNALKVRDGQWLVAAPGTAKELSDNLGITEGKTGNGIVLTIYGYYGRADPNIWEWIKSRWEQVGR